MRVELEVTAGAVMGERFVFAQHDTRIIGRSSKAHFQIVNDPHFSRHHFMIEVNPPQCFLRDLSSMNGTLVNGERVTQIHLKDGDVIHGGKTEFRVHVDRSAAPATTIFPRTELTLPVPGMPQGERMTSMQTRLLTDVLRRGTPGKLVCAVCGKPARDSLLGEFTDTALIVHVCPKCCKKKRDDTHPVPDFEVLGTLGEGELGTVYRARHEPTEEIVALKILPPAFRSDRRIVELFFREMQETARLSHPSLVALLGLGEAGDDLWIASEFVDGVDAAGLAEQLGGTVPMHDAVDIVCQVLRALNYVHAHGVVHGDVKPSNILVAGSAGAYTAKLTDLGLVRNVDLAGLSGITREGDARGAVPFMPPERVMDCRHATSRSDIYQAGASLYWLLTGQFAYDFERENARGDRVDPFLVILEDAIVPLQERNAELPKPLADAVGKSLARDPADRFATAKEMADALRRAAP